ncbi:hypothetical protein Agabi119p4_11165 [Agaricus bisporus var. burnettii]|uniref:Reverse transcriptase Ty1/copia-type domain-containing protein n=1 Tax=Agaricus bisporus var. burnettii TaxID=192524 RepID=A0A8H7C2M1_AGABI|nr:hypothetical protein Agabi119p4_11165 [Agaricus bisporus var. burnettii]
MIPAEPKVWQSAQRSAFTNALSISPVGKELSIAIKHAVRFMRTSAHSDTCVAWVDIHDSIAGTLARSYIGKTIVIGGRNCQIRGAAPRPGSALCTRCMRWGHHSLVCRSKGIRCPLCGLPHSEEAHITYCAHSKRDPDARSCVNCSAAGKTKRDHSATDTSSNPLSTPLAPGSELSDIIPSLEEQAEMRSVPYLNAVGALQYLATMTRPNIAYAVSYLGRFNSNPAPAHWLAVKHLFRYLIGTMHYKLVYQASDSEELFTTYSDASHGACKATGRATGGYVTLVSGAAGAMTRSPYFSLPVLNYSTSPYPADEVEAIRTEKEKDKRESSNLNTSTLSLVGAEQTAHHRLPNQGTVRSSESPVLLLGHHNLAHCLPKVEDKSCSPPGSNAGPLPNGRHILTEFGFPLTLPSTLFVDNKSGISVAKNPEHHRRMKHLDLRFYWLREAVEEGLIDPLYVSTHEQVADILTKAVAKKVVEFAVPLLGLE